MERKILILGMIIAVIGLILISVYSNEISSSQASAVSISRSLILSPNSVQYQTFIMNRSNTSFIFRYNASSPVSLYIMNSSAFNSISNDLSGNALQANVIALEGHGVLYVLPDSIFGTFPYANVSAAPVPTYQDNASVTLLKQDTYYIVFSNPGNSSSSVSYYSYQKALSNFSDVYDIVGPLGILASAMFLAGAIVIIYALLKKSKASIEAEEAEVMELYDKMEKRTPSKGKTGKHAKRKRKQ